MTDDREPFREPRAAWKAKHHEQRLESATYTAAEVKVLTEAALRLGRKEAGEDVYAALKKRRDDAIAVGDAGWPLLTFAMVVTLEITRMLASPDATSGRTDPNSTSAMLKSLEGGNG